MSSLIIDGISFYYGGAQDIGANIVVKHNFGPKRLCKLFKAKDHLSPTTLENEAFNDCCNGAAQYAKDLGANAIICMSHSSSFLIHRGQLTCAFSMQCDIVTLAPKED